MPVSNSQIPKSKADFLSSVVLFLFLFQNAYHFFSPILTIFLNFSIFIIFALSKLQRSSRLEVPKISIAYLFFVIFIVCMGYLSLCIQLSKETYLYLKFTRTLLSFLSIFLVISVLRVKSSLLIGFFGVVLFAHVITIYITIIFPEASTLLNFFKSQGDSRYSEWSFRKLGLMGSFDSSSFVAVSCGIFYLLKAAFVKRGGVILGLLALFSVAFISRFGMALATVVLLFFSCALIYKGHLFSKFGVIFSLVFVAYITWPFVASFILYSIGLESVSSVGALSSEYGSSATLNHLMDFSALNTLSSAQWLFGAGVDPGSELSKIRNTDVGYIKMIFHNGLFGVSLIIALYGIFLRFGYRVSRKSSDPALRLIGSFVCIYIVVTFAINWKSLEIMSRGGFEILSILVLSLVKLYREEQRKSYLALELRGI